MAGGAAVFRSYSHESDEHADRALALANALRAGGIDVILDRYVHPAPGQGWPRRMDQNLEAARFVLLVCTETYRRCALGLEEPAKGLGVDWEGNLIYNAIYHRIQNDPPSGSRFTQSFSPARSARTTITLPWVLSRDRRLRRIPERLTTPACREDGRPNSKGGVRCSVPNTSKTWFHSVAIPSGVPCKRV